MIGVYGDSWPYALAAILFGAGMWLLLPRGNAGGRRAGVGLTAAGLGLLTLLVHFGLAFHLRTAAATDEKDAKPAAAQPAFEFTASRPVLSGWTRDGVFLALAIVTVASAVGAVTMRSPVYCAIWFALTLLGTAGLFLYEGAQFLSVATVVVYAGAILVTFLFVLMLAQPEGHSFYDRLSWEALLSACSGAVLVGVLTMAVSSSLWSTKPGGHGVEPRAWLAERPRPIGAAEPTEIEARELAAAPDVLQPQHMARLGGQLFSKHLIAVEVAGTLLLVALVGAIAIVHQSKPVGGAHG